jgi:hypothetical protein
MDTSLLTIVDFRIGDKVFKLCEMTFGIARQHVKDGRELVAKGAEGTAEEWYDRTILTVAAALKRADENTQWTAEKLQTELGKNSIDAMYLRILEISGLRLPGVSTTGEAKAA